MRDFKQLKVWQKAHRLALEIYRHTQSFPAEERFGLTIQLRRAAASVPSTSPKERAETPTWTSPDSSASPPALPARSSISSCSLEISTTSQRSLTASSIARSTRSNECSTASSSP